MESNMFNLFSRFTKNDLGSKPKILIFSGVDRCGKSTMIQEVNIQTNYKHFTMDRFVCGFQTYCEIFNRPTEFQVEYKKFENIFNDLSKILMIYLDCSTEELTKRCKKTNHKIIDFDYHKSVYEYYYEQSILPKIKIDTTNKHVKDWVKELIEQNII